LKTLTAARDAYAQNEIKDAEAPELSLYQRQLHQAKYARWLEDENRRETWPETVQRYVNFISEYIAKYHCDLDPAVYDDIREAILRMDVLPSMRGLMTAGKAAWRDQTSLYNCAALSIDRIHAFDEALYLLCAGVGVGFSVENKYIAKLPEVPSELHYSDSVIVVPDSKIGWATSLRQLIAMLYAGLIPKWDLSRIRPEGARLKTMGGRASGKRPLAELFNFTVEVFQQAKGRKLNSLEVHSIMCKIGDIVVVGGVRRAALLSLSDPSDARMRDAKSGQWWEDSPWLALANNSAAWEEKPDINHFIEEWMGLMRSGSGERGIFNRKAAQAKAMKYGREPLDFLTNPCVTGDTWIMTQDGPRQVVDLIDKPFTAMINGVAYSSSPEGFWASGYKPILRIRTKEGYELKVTHNHKILTESYKWVEAKDLLPGDKVQLHDHSSMAPWEGKGTFAEDQRLDNLHGDTCIESGSYEFHARYLKELFDANGSVESSQEKGISVRLLHSDLDALKVAQRMLLRLGIKSAIYKNRASGDERVSSDENDAHELVISDQSIMRFKDEVGFLDPHKASLLEDFTSQYVREPYDGPFLATIDALIKESPDSVFDCSISEVNAFDANGLFVHNCGEILLNGNPGQLCNLSQITVRPEDQKEDLFRKVEIATIIGTLQSCVTRFRYLNPRWQKNCENERLLGVGMTGIMENDLLNGSGSKEELADLLSQLREHARAVNKKYAEILEINPSAAITCIKPAGNSTQLVGSHCSGLHEAYSRFYIRRNRMNKNDPVAQLLYMSGVPCEDEIFHPDTTWVFSYPMKAPENAILRTDRTAIERLEHWLVYLDHWCEHNPSVTISVEEDEWLEVGAWVYKHFDKMVGVSFLPFSKHVYQQAPYEEISEEEYNKLVAEMPKDVNWELLKEIEKEDMTDSVKELACTSGACELT
jgi:hypothetical protein